MAKYVDAFVAPVPEQRMDEYKALAEMCSEVWKKYGALEYVECIQDDVKPGKVTSFPQSVKAEPGEVVICSFITYKDRAHRDEVFEKVMADPKMKDMKPSDMPFDAMRMFWGGFQSFVDA